jgi:hypothetical protein
MKLSFLYVLFFTNQLAFSAAAPFLNADMQSGQIGDDVLLKQEAGRLTKVAMEFRSSTLADQNRRAQHLKSALQPMFKSLPKNGYGKLEPQVARYALHRLFEQQHAWSVDGLKAMQSANHNDVFGDLTADADSAGISIEYLALLAAVLEARIHGETVAQIRTSYDAVYPDDAEEDVEMSATELDNFVNRYMTIYISGMREYNLTEVELDEQNNYMEKSTLDWEATKNWIHDAQHDAMRSMKPCGHGVTDCYFDLQSTALVIEKLLKGYGEFNGGECKRLKQDLLKMDDYNSGRVSLADFYKAGMSGTWELNEKVDYLRDLGTLDESLPGRPRVIVANYVNSWVNCLTSSSMYSVCCRNECEDLMGHLESQVEAPAVSPRRILELLQNMDSASLPAPLNISKRLNDRLQDIASRHQGRVPLHGRLFAQWLHHVFPQSCPYPHTAGATNPLTPDEWMKETGQTAIKASHDEIMRAVNDVAVDVKGGVRSAIKVGGADFEEWQVPWTDDEEVFTIRVAKEAEHDVQFINLDAVVMLAEAAASVSLMFAILHVAGTYRRSKVLKSPDFAKYSI